MNTIDLAATPRELGNKSSKRTARLSGLVPCVLYGVEQPLHFQVQTTALAKVVNTPETYLVKLQLPSGVHQAVVREIQVDPVHDVIIHVDFQEVTESRPVELDLPVRLEGTSPGMLAGGKLIQKARRLRVRGLLKHIPDRLTVDVSGLALGKSLKVRELSFPELQITMPGDLPVATIEIPRALRQGRPEGPAAK